MDAFTVNLFAGISGGSGTATVDLGRRRTFFAWGTLHSIDSTAVFDRDNAAVVDIVDIDGNGVGGLIFGGDHFGGDGSPENVRLGALTGTGQRITFRLRAFHSEDLSVYATGTVLAL
jgi:hypothetical protein